jgi:hypothetical protein
VSAKGMNETRTALHAFDYDVVSKGRNSAKCLQ